MKMTESEKKEYERIQAKIVNKLAIVLGCAAIIFVIWVYFHVRDRDRSLRMHTKYTPAYIEEISGRPRGGPRVSLIYKHDGKIYSSTVCYRPRNETFSMKPPREGDSCIVAYDSLNPRCCTIYKDFRR